MGVGGGRARSNQWLKNKAFLHDLHDPANQNSRIFISGNVHSCVKWAEN